MTVPGNAAEPPDRYRTHFEHPHARSAPVRRTPVAMEARNSRTVKPLKALKLPPAQTVTVTHIVRHGLGSAASPHPTAARGNRSRSRSIRPRMAANSSRGTATSATWNITYRACRTTLAPILMSFSRSVVSVQC